MSDGGIFVTEDFAKLRDAAEEGKPERATEELWRLILDTWFPANELYTIKRETPRKEAHQVVDSIMLKVSKDDKIIFVVFCRNDGLNDFGSGRNWLGDYLTSVRYMYTATYGACAAGSKVEFHKLNTAILGHGGALMLTKIGEEQEPLDLLKKDQQTIVKERLTQFKRIGWTPVKPPS